MDVASFIQAPINFYSFRCAANDSFVVLCNSGILPAVDLISGHVLVGVSLQFVPQYILISLSCTFRMPFLLKRKYYKFLQKPCTGHALSSWKVMEAL